MEFEYGPSAFDRHKTALFKLAQISIVNEFHIQFTTLAIRIIGLDL